MAHTELNLRERRVIEDMLNAKVSVRAIATQIGRHVSTVYRDIKRNGYADDNRMGIMAWLHTERRRRDAPSLSIGAPW